MRPMKMFLLPFLLLTLSCSSDDLNNTEAAPLPVEPVVPYDDHRIASDLINNIHLPDAQKSQLLDEVTDAVEGFQGINTLQDAVYSGFNAQYNDPETNQEFIPGVGYLYLNPERIDTEFSPGEPEGIIFAEDGSGNLVVSGVAYLIKGNAAQPPVGFTGDADQWRWNPADEAWSMNAWLGGDNPFGVFAYRRPGLISN